MWHFYISIVTVEREVLKWLYSNQDATAFSSAYVYFWIPTVGITLGK